jgi:hypothetical protein
LAEPCPKCGKCSTLKPLSTRCIGEAPGAEAVWKLDAITPTN